MARTYLSSTTRKATPVAIVALATAKCRSARMRFLIAGMRGLRRIDLLQVWKRRLVMDRDEGLWVFEWRRMDGVWFDILLFTRRLSSFSFSIFLYSAIHFCLSAFVNPEQTVA